MFTHDLSASDFDHVTGRLGIALVDWWAPWCGPCLAFAPIYEQVARSHPDVVFAKVNTEEQRALSARFGVRAIPTLMVFRDGILVFEQAGALPASILEDLVRKVRVLDMAAVRAEAEAASSVH